METLLIKGMVCDRCITILKKEFSNLGLEISAISLGEIMIIDQSPIVEEEIIDNILKKHGFELLYDRDKMLIEAIKAIVSKGITLQLESKNNIKFSHLISEALQREYSYLSSLFSGVEGITLEKYIIHQRISKVKETLINTSKSLTQISDEFGYSSVSHLSRQLKSYTGKDAFFFKSLKKSQIQIYPS